MSFIVKHWEQVCLMERAQKTVRQYVRPPMSPLDEDGAAILARKINMGKLGGHS